MPTSDVQAELDELLAEFKTAVEEWIAAIHTEEDFAKPDHSVKDWDAWDQAGFKEEEARKQAKAARKAYVDALRQKFYNF